MKHLIKLKKKSLSCLLLLTLLSCSSGETRQKISEAPYRSSGVEQFFLPELPQWGQFSAPGRCFKSSSFQYLDFKKVRANFELSYAEIVELQGQYNERRENYFSSAALRFLRPVEEAAFFLNTLEQVRAGVKLFKVPQALAVDVIWLEGFSPEELKSLIRKGRFNERPPILFSSCLSRQRLQQWVSQQGLDEAGFFLLGAEWLSPFDSDFRPVPGLQLELSQLLSHEVKIHVVTPETKFSVIELIF